MKWKLGQPRAAGRRCRNSAGSIFGPALTSVEVRRARPQGAQRARCLLFLPRDVGSLENARTE